jgi:hypothetical protein
MINALVVFKVDDFVTDEINQQIRSKSLANAKQFVCGTLGDEIVVGLAANAVKDLNVALGECAKMPGVKKVTLVRITEINGAALPPICDDNRP